jgi:adenosylcobinamide-GDP ribazoletransferase
MQNLLTAFKFLTLGIHRHGVQILPEHVGAATLYFPLVGLALGFTLNILNRGMEPYLASEILSVVIVAILAVLTTATHLEGLQRTFDLLQTNTESADRVLAPVGIMGFLATLFVVLLKVRSIEVMGEPLGLSLLLTPMFARWGLVMFMYGSTVTLDDRVGAMAAHVKTWHMLVTSAATLGFAFLLAGRTALWIGLCVSLLALLSRHFLCRRQGGITYDNFGALIEISEALSFLFFASV